MELPFLNRNMDGLLPFAHSPIAEIPSVVVPATDVVINKTTAEAIGADIPEEVASEAILVEDAK